jgi:lysophospholipase L1-like esterase
MLIGLGDSLTRGIGDASGQGYFGMVKKALQEKNTSDFSAVNLAVSGSTSPELVKQVQQERVQELLKKANWVTITIGGNDLFRGSGRLEKIDEKAAEKARLTYAENLSQILTTIQQQNKEATIFIFGLYNPFGDLPEERRSSRLVAEWNETTHKVAARFDRVVVVPTFDLFQLQPSQYLYDDHFHPNQLGYERMAQRLLQVINDKPKEAKTAYGK